MSEKMSVSLNFSVPDNCIANDFAYGAPLGYLLISKFFQERSNFQTAEETQITYVSFSEQGEYLCLTVEQEKTEHTRAIDELGRTVVPPKFAKKYGIEEGKLLMLNLINRNTLLVRRLDK